MSQVQIMSFHPKFVLYAPKKSVLFARLGLIFCTVFTKLKSFFEEYNTPLIKYHALFSHCFKGNAVY